ncbi:Ammonia channel [Alphaproteobacteria bacterium SO-S41]|nr:Ammonia channel [Alphaproteobacteria bacterium SO-S41]
MSKLNRLAGVCSAGALAALAFAGAAFAQDPAASPIPPAAFDSGGTTWMMVSSVLVLAMTIPGLALFYGGLVRQKNMLSVLMQVSSILCVVAIIWVVYGYSLAFTDGGSLNAYVGGFSKMFLAGVDFAGLDPTKGAATFSNGLYLPELVYILFQMTFACITPALIIGAVAERVKFSGLIVFCALWVTLVYFPIAHMVWFWPGPDGVAAATLAGAEVRSGMVWGWGALDFAGGTVVHINAGIAGLVLCILMGKRLGYGKDAMPPHSLVMSMIGAALLWVGWFGFNAGSNLAADGIAALAAMNTFVATAAAAVGWVLIEWITKGHPSLLGAISGMVAGLVAITPAAGFAGPNGAIILGFVAGLVCFFFCTTVKNIFKYDDSLDVFGVHCIGGIIGAIGTAIVANPDFMGQGWLDYAASPGTAVAGAYDMTAQIITQAKAVGVTLVWSGVISAILYYVVHFTIGMRVSADAEREGLDITSHGERAYNM